MAIQLRTGHGKALRNKKFKSLSADDARMIVEAIKSPAKTDRALRIRTAETEGSKAFKFSTNKLAESAG